MVARTRADQIFERWQAYHREHPETFRLFISFTFDVINAGKHHFSADAIMHRIRWFTTVERTSGTVKISNDYAAWYSRLFAAVYPQHADIFSRRVLRSSRRPAAAVDFDAIIDPVDTSRDTRVVELAGEWMKTVTSKQGE